MTTGKVMCFKSTAYVAPHRVYSRAADDIDKESARPFTFYRLPFRHYNGISDSGVSDFGREPYRPDSSPGRDGLQAGVTSYIRPGPRGSGISLRQNAGSPVVQVIRQ
jgi:hypothetical protein